MGGERTGDADGGGHVVRNAASARQQFFGGNERPFTALGEGSKVTMPLQDTFWGARFGSLTHRFGIQWSFNCWI
jgi:hypothetical protein